MVCALNYLRSKNIIFVDLLDRINTETIFFVSSLKLGCFIFSFIFYIIGLFTGWYTCFKENETVTVKASYENEICNPIIVKDQYYSAFIFVLMIPLMCPLLIFSNDRIIIKMQEFLQRRNSKLSLYAFIIFTRKILYIIIIICEIKLVDWIKASKIGHEGSKYCDFKSHLIEICKQATLSISKIQNIFNSSVISNTIDCDLKGEQKVVCLMNPFNGSIFSLLQLYFYYALISNAILLLILCYYFTKSSRIDFIRKPVILDLTILDTNNEAFQNFVFNYLKQDGVLLLRLMDNKFN